MKCPHCNADWPDTEAHCPRCDAFRFPIGNGTILTQRDGQQPEPCQNSVNVPIRPQDRECRYWAKIIRANEKLPKPLEVGNSRDIPGPYLRHGEEELFDGDVLFEGEERHPTKQRGWKYTVCFIGPKSARTYIEPTPAMGLKQIMKDRGMPAELLIGSGDIAACVRFAWALRLGMMDAITKGTA